VLVEENVTIMKKLTKLTALFALMIGMLSFVSCDKDDEEKPNIVELAQSNPNLSILVQAVVKADLATTLSGTGPFTVFAPTNAAFTKLLGDLGFSSLDDVPVDVLTQILLNHVVSGKILAKDVPTGYASTLANGPGSSKLSIYFNTASGVKINGTVNVTTADVEASNGVVHVVDAVITLPTLATFAVADPTFSTLVGAASAASSVGDLTLVQILAGAPGAPQPLTVFAPTNAAFAKIASVIPTLTADQVRDIILGHVVAGNVRSSALPVSGVSAVNTNFVLDVQTTPSPNIDVTGGSQNVGIVAVDVQASNGVIHAIESVLLLD
jgi:uncharacterized surface protein with fasciclin (FAS1) repeats